MTGAHRNIKNIASYAFSRGALDMVPDLLAQRRAAAPSGSARVVFLIDDFFSSRESRVVSPLGVEAGDAVRFVSTTDEPSTEHIDALVDDLKATGFATPVAVVGMGGGTTLDTAKAVSNLLCNPGRAADYQGWDLVPNPGVYKIGIPTLSGTGAESSRTCVMTNHVTGLKLGMNSDHTLYDQLVLDPDLTATVERNQYFYTGMDAYIHCVESLAGRYRNPIGDAFSEEVVTLCRRVFLGGDMMTPDNRERLMTASYLGGCALASSFVGLVHPLSAGLSVVLGLHHCVANCVTILALDEFYPDECREFRAMVAAQGVTVPSGVGRAATAQQIEQMCAATVLHEKPLANALGPDFRAILTTERMTALFRQM